MDGMTLRQERILRFCDVDGFGLEIGASFNPIAAKKDGYRIEVLDYLSREELISKYKDQPSTPKNIEEQIEEVDYVWHGEKYSSLVKRHFDYIISSHLIEHIMDLIGHINDCCEILNEGGVYSLVIPDKRYGFDILRKETTVEDIIERMGQSQYTDEMIMNYVTGVVKNGENISWGKLCTENDFKPVYSEEDRKLVKEHPEMFALDIHASVFTPDSFRCIMEELFRRGLINMPLVYIDEDTEYGEFYAVFKKGARQEEKELFGYKACNYLIREDCWIDKLVVENGYLIAEGFSSVRGKPPVKTILQIGDTEICTTRKMRPDLSNDINNNKYGFFGMISMGKIKEGLHMLQITSQDCDGQRALYRYTVLYIKKGQVTDIVSSKLKTIKKRISFALKQ
ncbi:MAG: hypothetical protein ACI4AA_02710 [Lachnospiraceae bacterium]